MGAKLSQHFQFSVPVTEPKETETSIYRNVQTMYTGPLKVNKYNYQTVYEALIANIKKGNGDKNFLGYRNRITKGNYEKKYTWISYKDFIDQAKNFGLGLNKLNLCPFTQVENDDKFRFFGIYSKNKYEWFLGYFGAMSDSITTVTLYDTLGIQAMEHILTQTKLQTILIEASSVKKLLTFLKESQKEIYLQNLIVIEKEDDIESCNEMGKFGINLFTVEDIIKAGKENADYSLTPPNSNSPCIILYTSGTTGVPKGVVLNHSSILANTDFVDITGLSFGNDEIHLSYLPLAHAMENVFFTVMLCYGMAIGIYSGDPRRITEDAQLLNPTTTIGVPRVLQRIYMGIQETVKKLPKPIQKMFYKGIEIKISDFRKYGYIYNVFWDNLVFKKTKHLLGKRLKMMFIGSAPMNPDILDFLKCSLCCNIGQGYGQTENCVISACSHFFETDNHHIGGPTLGCEWKLIDVPELGYFTNDKDLNTGLVHPRGEICTRGTVVFDRYLAEETKTKETKENDGWLHSGDIAELIPEHGNCFKIIDRVKNIFKLSQGEYIAPEKIESLLSTDKYVEQIFVTGNSFENYLVAIVYPNKKKIIEFLVNKGYDANEKNYKEYFNKKELKDEIINSMEKVGRDNDFKGFEIVKKIKLIDFPFTVENDLFSPTLKLKRHVATKRFKQDVDELYKS